jgi:hypothetical protein
MLHVTNGESAVMTLAAAGIGPAIAWRDVLHEGPVPSGLNADELRHVRAEFLAGCGWGEAASIAADMRARDTTLLEAKEVTLWFEHDLYDQLQLLQILWMLDGRSARLAQADTFIGPMRTGELRALAERIRPVTEEDYDVARRSWAAFRSPEPTAIPDLLRTDISCLRHLRGAFGRLLEERPGTADGLSRTERQILQVVAMAPPSFADLFVRTQAMEEAAFAGDEQILLSLQRLTACNLPLLVTDGWRLTEAGRSVLDGASSHMELNRVDRWLGGMRFVS